MTKLIKYTFLGSLFCLPLFFTMSNSELFEFPKLILIYITTIILTTLHLTNYYLGQAPLYLKNKVSFFFIFFLISQILSTIFSIDRHISIYGYYSRFNGGLMSTVCYFLIFNILLVYADKQFSQQIINVSLASSFFIGLYAIGQHFGIDRHLWVQDVQNRVFSTLGQPNWLAAYLSIIISFLLSRIDQDTSNSNLKSYFLFFIYFSSLLFTKSRSGLIATSIPLSYFFVKMQTKKAYRQNIIVSLLIIIPLILFSNPIKDKILPKQIIPSPANETSEILNITPSQNIRKIVWQGALDLWKKFPLLGTGVETFAISYYWVRPVVHNLTSEWDFLYNKAHNEYLNLAATTGTFGLISYLILITFCLKNLKEYPYLFLAYLTIIITNFTGFSVVVTSLYFYLIPTLSFSPPKHLAQKPNLKKYLIIPTYLLAFYLISSTFAYFFADKNYFYSQQYLSKYPQQSLSRINKSLLSRPNEPEYLIHQAEVLTNLSLNTNNQDFSNLALKNLSRVEEISPFHPNYLKKSAQILFNLGRHQAAINLIIKTSLLAPTDAKTYFILGTFYQNTSQIDLALKAYQQAIELKSNYDHAHMALALIYLDKLDYQNSLKHFQSAYNINPKNQEALKYINQITKKLKEI